MAAFATADDYKARYGAVEDEARLTVLLEDATSYLLALYYKEYGEEYAQGVHPVFDASAPAVCCAMVSRTLNTPTGLEGVSNVSQSADVYSASYTFANPTGDFYLTKSDKERLGIGAATVGTIAPLTIKDRPEESAGE